MPELDRAGDNLEYLASRVFQGEGFVVRRDIPVRLGRGVDVTDIDVLGIKFVYPFQPVILICDCKDRVKSQAAGRVFWAKGLAACLGATEVYVVTKSARLEVVHFAAENNVRVLTAEVLREYTDRSGLFSRRPYGHADADIIGPFLHQTSEGMRRDPTAKDAVFRAMSAFQHVNPYEDFNICMQEIEAATKILIGLGNGNSSAKVAWIYVLANLVVALSLHLLFICGDVITMNTTQRRQHIMDRLTFGSMDRGQAIAIVDATLNIAKAASSSPTPVLPNARQVFAPPVYADDTVGLVERALLNPEMYHQLPRVLDFTIFGKGLGQGNPNSDELRDQFGLINPSEAIKALRNIFAFLNTHTPFLADMLLRNVSSEAKAVPSSQGVSTSDVSANYRASLRADAQPAAPQQSGYVVHETRSSYNEPNREVDRTMTIEQLELIASGKAAVEEPNQTSPSEHKPSDTGTSA